MMMVKICIEKIIQENLISCEEGFEGESSCSKENVSEEKSSNKENEKGHLDNRLTAKLFVVFCVHV